MDPTGVVVEEADLTLRGPLLRDGARRAQTDARGEYRFAALPPGTYDLTASRAGFTPIRREQIVLPVGASRVVDFNLTLAGLTAQVDVGARVPAVDVRSSASPALLDRNLLASLPVSRQFDDLINLTPGVTESVGFGGTQGSNALYLNGVETTDPQHQSPLLEFNHNWLEQVEVVALGGDAQLGPFTGVAANAIVRAGGNQFSGLGEYWTTRSGWVADNTGSLSEDLQEEFEPRRILSLWDSSLQVGGPVVRDRMWFFSGLQISNHDDIPAGYSGPGSTADDTRRFIVRIDTATATNVHLEGLYERGWSEASGVGLGPFRALPATQNVVNRNHLWSARIAWGANDRTLVEATTGGFTSANVANPRPPNTRLGPPGVVDSSTSPPTVTVNSIGYSDTDRSRSDTTVSATRFMNVLGQTHELEVGAEIDHSRAADRCRMSPDPDIASETSARGETAWIRKNAIEGGSCNRAPRWRGWPWEPDGGRALRHRLRRRPPRASKS